MRASSATYFGADGLLKTAAINEPRIDHDPVTREPLGLLIEEARTNLLLRSSEFDHSYWAKTNVIVTPNAALASDGTITMDKIIETATGGPHQVLTPPITLVVGSAYTFSVFVKKAERSRLRIDGNDAGVGVGNSAEFDLVSETWTNFGDVVARLDKVSKDIYRASVTFTAIATVAQFVPILLNSDGLAIYTGDGVSGLYLWGAQLEAGAFPTSYIPTAAAQATRAEDLMVIPSSGWLADGVGTLLVRHLKPRAGASSTLACMTEAATGYGRRLQWGYNANRNSLSFINVPPSPGSPETLVIAVLTDDLRYVTAWDDSLMAACVNGGAVTQRMPVEPIQRGLRYLRLGTIGGASLLNGHIKRVTYFPRRLSNAELQEITT